MDEHTEIDCEGLHAYGLNRYCLECWVREQYPDALIIRLPGLFGQNIKKNFIYDYIHVIPFMLKQEKYEELLGFEENSEQERNLLTDCYEYQSNGFYRCKNLTEQQRELLKHLFNKMEFTALNFTDSRNIYQFYPLDRLWDDIQIALEKHILLWHPATEPISAGDLYQYLSGKQFVNELSGVPIKYDYRTIYAEIFGGRNGYICSEAAILQAIANFVNR